MERKNVLMPDNEPTDQELDILMEDVLQDVLQKAKLAKEKFELLMQMEIEKLKLKPNL